MPQTRLRILCAVASLAGIALCSPPLLAQEVPPAPAPAPAFTEPVALSPTPVPIGTLGLTLYLPENAAVQTDNLPGGKVRTLIQPDDGTWAIQIYNSRSSNLELTAGEALTAAANLIMLNGPQRQTIQRDGSRLQTPLLEPVDRTDDLRIGAASAESPGVSAARVYILASDYQEGTPRSDGPMGFTILRTSPGNFITIQLDCPYPHYQRARRIYETIVAAARLSDPSKSDELRRLRLLAGESFLSTITRQDLDELMESEEPVWTRIYEPAPSGSPRDAREVGFQRTEIRLGQLGELDPAKRRIDWSTEDRAYGYFMRVDAWMLREPTASAPAGVVPEYFTTQATFFLSRDRTEELWTVQIDLPNAGQRERSTLTFIRRGTRVTVRTELPRSETQTAEFAIIPKNYLSGIERALLPRIIARKAESGAGLFELGFYTYDAARGSITYRSETFAPAAANGWLQTTIPFENGLPWTTTLDSEGKLVTQALPPARVIEPMEREAIRRLWASKGLVTDEGRRNLGP